MAPEPGVKAGELSDEQSLYSIVLAVPAELGSFGEQEGVFDSSAGLSRKELEGSLVALGAHPTWLLDGSLLLTLMPSDSAHDQATQAARCALVVKAQWPTAAVALATGRGHVAGRALIGEVVDRAACLLRDRQLLLRDDPKAAAAEPGSVWVDSLSASLLERRCALVPVKNAALLTGEAMPSDEARPLLGVLTPCVGREQELTILDAILSRCKGEAETQAVLLTAPSGIGKTRLRQEFLTRLRRRSQPAMVLLGLGELVSAGAPYRMLGQALRRACSIPDGADPAMAQKRLIMRCTELLGEAAGEQAARFFGEICSLPFSDDKSPELRAARGTARTMADHILHAFSEFLGAWCERAAVMLVLDDLQWGDLLTINLVDGVLRSLKGRPFMVLALGRPEVKTLFPKVRQWPNVKEIPLDGLSRSASERLVRIVLGDAISQSAVSRIVQHAAGNALLLEELLRAEHERQGEEPPETVLAILQARLQRLEMEERLLLCKASVFGQRFLRGGVQALLEAAQADLDVDAVLHALSKAELLTAPKLTRHEGEAEYAFRHPLMREAAYSLLIDEQKPRWHRVAGEYLERMGETDAAVLAEHFGRSDQPSRSVRYFIRAASLALEGNDFVRAQSYLSRGLDCLARGQASGQAESQTGRELRSELLSLQSSLFYESLKLEASHEQGTAALRLLTPGGRRWCGTLSFMASTSLLLGRSDTIRELASRFLDSEPQGESVPVFLAAGGALLSTLSLAGERTAGRSLLARLEGMSTQLLEQELSAKIWLRFGQSQLARISEGDPWTAWRHAEEAAETAERVGNSSWLALTQGEAALAELELGSLRGEVKLRAALETLSATNNEIFQGYIAASAALWLSVRSGCADEATELARMTLARHQGNVLFSGMAHWALSRACLTVGAVATAESEARAALTLLQAAPPLRLGIFALLIRLLLSRGRLDEARAMAEAGVAQLRALDGMGIMDMDLRLAVVELRHLMGDREGALAKLRLALSALRVRAARILDPVWRRRYLEDVVPNACLRTLSWQQLGEEVESAPP